MADRQRDGQAMMGEQATMRLDRFLWFARLCKTRAQAQALAESGSLRLDGRRIERAHAPVRCGQVVAFVQAGRVRVIRIVALPVRRGPPAEGAASYADIANPVDAPGARA